MDCLDENVNTVDYDYLRNALQDHRKFQQRYYEFLDYFRMPDGPIFLVIGGEAPLNGISNDYISVSINFLVHI